MTPSKMMLGPSAGGAVRFGPDGPVIALAEGIETATFRGPSFPPDCMGHLEHQRAKGAYPARATRGRGGDSLRR